jgi:hypothetical protein
LGDGDVPRTTKVGPRRNHDEDLIQLRANVPRGDDEGRYTAAFRIGLFQAKLDIEEGRLVPLREAKKRLAL